MILHGQKDDSLEVQVISKHYTNIIAIISASDNNCITTNKTLQTKPNTIIL